MDKLVLEGVEILPQLDVRVCAHVLCVCMQV